MPRRARLQLPGCPLHVIQRGHNRARCFATESDFSTYLGILEECCRIHPCRVHAYVLMPNHVHLLLTPDDPVNLSRAMRRLGQRYAQHFNRANARTGALWEDRFKSFAVDTHAYLLKCQRYIEQNPVRAGLVRHPGDYAWSSYRYNADGWATTLIQPHPIFVQMIGNDGRFLDAYRQFLREMPEPTETGTIRKGGTYPHSVPPPSPG